MRINEITRHEWQAMNDEERKAARAKENAEVEKTSAEAKLKKPPKSKFERDKKEL